ncbi:MAG: hypothetical protein L3J71_10855 [Victivallaceae bacterium]|nr:hypothetical protein [Victivallaceae bacterium]
MKKSMILIAMMVMTNLAVSLPVKITKKILKNGVTAHECTFITGNVNYRLNFHSTLKDDREYIKGIGLMGGVSAKRFSKRGWWYGPNGFLKLNVWGKNIFKMPVTYKSDDGVIEFTFSEGNKTVKIIFRAQENDDKLFMGIDFSESPQRGVMKLTCYPGNMLKKYPEKRDRYANTAKRSIQWQKKVSRIKLEKDEYWIYYEDRKFDTSKSTYFSTCALLYNPNEVKAVNLLVSSYAIVTEVLFSPDKQNYNFILWEFPGRKNAKCLEAMKSLEINFN